MVAITNTTSLMFLKDELDVTFHEAEKHLEKWVEDHSQTEAISACVEAFHSVRGIFQVLELRGAVLMAEEMEMLSQSLQTADDPDVLSAALSQGIILITRYLEYVQLKDRGLPELLISGINELRRALGKALIQESHFFAVDLGRERYPQPDTPETPRSDLPRLCRRLRHMYQVGLISVLRDKESSTGLKLMNRALTRIDRLCGPVQMGRLWWVARGMLEAMIVDDMALTPARKNFLGQVDRQIKRVIYEGESSLDKDVPLLLIKEGLYVVSLCSRSPGIVGELKQAFDLRPGLTDAELQDEISLMSGGNGSVVRSVAEGLKEELGHLKQSLDLAAQGVADNDYNDVADVMAKVASTLAMVNLNQEAARIKETAGKVRSWQGQDVDPEGLDFQEMVDDLLMVENAVATLERSFAPRDDVHKDAANSSISLYQLDDARMAVVGESRSGLSLTKRAVSSFMESNWDPMHLANLPSILAGVSGGLTFLDLGRARGVLDACRSYIEQTLLASNAETPTREQMDTLADAITSLDYYLESMEEQKPIGETVLEVAEESMEELGYPVVRASGL